MSIKIVTDSGADLPKEIIEEYQIEVVPLTVTFPDDHSNYIDGVTMTPEQFTQKLLRSKQLPKTSQPSPQQFNQVFKDAVSKGQKVLCVSLSSGLSGTYNSACLAKGMVGEGIHIIDSLCASTGVGVLAIKAAQLVKAGIDYQQILTQITVYRDTMKTLFTLDNLDNIVKGGRLNKVQGLIGNALNIKPIFAGDELGQVVVVEKIRGRNRSLKRLITMMEDSACDWSRRIVAVSHVACLEEANWVKNEIVNKFHPEQVIVAPMGCTVGTYAGKGGIIVTY